MGHPIQSNKDSIYTECRVSRHYRLVPDREDCDYIRICICTEFGDYSGWSGWVENELTISRNKCYLSTTGVARHQ